MRAEATRLDDYLRFALALTLFFAFATQVPDSARFGCILASLFIQWLSALMWYTLYRTCPSRTTASSRSCLPLCCADCCGVSSSASKGGYEAMTLVRVVRDVLALVVLREVDRRAAAAACRARCARRGRWPSRRRDLGSSCGGARSRCSGFSRRTARARAAALSRGLRLRSSSPWPPRLKMSGLSTIFCFFPSPVLTTKVRRSPLSASFDPFLFAVLPVSPFPQLFLFIPRADIARPTEKGHAQVLLLLPVRPDLA